MTLRSSNFAFTYAAGRYYFGCGGGLVEAGADSR